MAGGRKADKPPSNASTKRTKPNAEDSSLSSSEPILRQTLLSAESRGEHKASFASAQPFRHCMLHDVFNPASLIRVRDEIINNIEATYKETDIFKVFQTGDLGNLARLDAGAASKLPTLMKLKSELYSEEMRAFMKDVSGCGDLSDKIDCSCNVYADGGHLLCHDDVIGTRRVSWIVYLTDPEEPWTAEDGGALELYPQAPVNLLPIFNTMAMFVVEPGRSFHSVQEVMNSDKPRMSISGWYHAPQEPDDAPKASLKQLQQLKAGEDLEGKQYKPFTPDSSNPSGSLDLDDDDLALLVRFVNPSYLSEDSWPKIQAKFEEDGSVQLQNFLKKGVSEKILAALVAEDARDGLGSGSRPPMAYKAGISGGWTAVGPPHKQRYARYDGAADDTSCGSQMAAIRDRLFRSGAFRRLLRKFTTLTMVGQRTEIRRFRPGLDYTVAHYGILTKDPRLDVVLCFVDASPSSGAAPGPSSAALGGASTSADAAGGSEAAGDMDKAAAWDAGEVGGFEAYLLAEDDKEGAAAADTYRTAEGEESGVLNLSAAPNSLNLVLRDEGLMKFVKYVSYQAPSSRWDLAMECLPEDDDSDAEEPKAGSDAAGC